MGRKQKKTITLDWTTKETLVTSNHSAPARSLRKTDLGAVIFGTTHNTINECLSRQLFGLPEGHFSYIKNIKPGLVLFLFNYSDRKLHGVFEATGNGQLNIDKYAWANDGDDAGYTWYPAQVKFCVRELCNPLSEQQFQPIIAPNYYDSKHFYFELDHDQTEKLVSLFKLSPFNFGISTKWSSLYAFLPENTRRHEYNSRVPLMQTLPESPNQTSEVSYASTLCGTTIGTSSQPARKWSALFKTEESFETLNDERFGNESRHVATTTNEFTSGWEDGPSHVAYATGEELPFNQSYEGAGEFFQTDTAEGRYWDEWNQTWVSDANVEASFEADNTNVVQGNTWEESHVMHTTREVENEWTLDSSGQNVTKIPSSHQSLDDDNVDLLSIETSDNDSEESHEKDNSLIPNTVVDAAANEQTLMTKLIQEVEEMKVSQLKCIVKMNMLEQELDASKQEVLQLRNRVSVLESEPLTTLDPVEMDDQTPSEFLAKFSESVLIVGGHDGAKWLTNLDYYLPSKDVMISLSPMNFIKSYASAAIMNGEVYHFGGEGPNTVESYDPTSNQWTSRPSMFWKNINAAGTSVMNKLFVVGGAAGSQCSAEVEYLDMNIGKWTPSRSMQNKRLASAAVELNNILYVSGGYDGTAYSRSVERFDPREEVWSTVPNMNTPKGCHSMIVLNEKLYTIGGFSGNGYIATAEYLDTRMGGWVEAEPMNVSRGNFGCFVAGEKIYTLGGRAENDEVLDIVECYKEGSGWEVADDMKAIGKRSHLSAFVM